MRWYHRRVDTRTGERYYEHRAIAEWKIGRPLRPGEVVHHKNNDPRDNHPSNLIVLPSQSAHMRLHHFERREAAGVQHLFPIQVFMQEHDQPTQGASPADPVLHASLPPNKKVVHADMRH